MVKFTRHKPVVQLVNRIVFPCISLVVCVSCIRIDSLSVLPDVGQHEHKRGDDDDLQDLPITAQRRQTGHQQLTPHDDQAGDHGHRETPRRQTQLDPWANHQH